MNAINFGASNSVFHLFQLFVNYKNWKNLYLRQIEEYEVVFRKESEEYNTCDLKVCLFGTYIFLQKHLCNTVYLLKFPNKLWTP